MYKSVNETYGVLQSPRGGYTRSRGYQQPVSYNYQPGLAYQPYRYTPYGPEYVYPQGVYNPYAGQQYLPVYGFPSTISSSGGVYPYGHLRQPMPAGQGYSVLQGYAMPGLNIMHVTRPNVTGAPIATFSNVPAPYSIGIAAPNPSQAQIVLRPPKTTQTNADKTVG